NVSVNDILPGGFTIFTLSGQGWTCATDPTPKCSRSDVLAPGASYPPIILIVNVPTDAPPSVTNTAVVAGGGDQTPANDTATDPTPILHPPNHSTANADTGNFPPGKSGTYTIVVPNGGQGPTTGTVTISDTLPAGLTATAAIGTGWTCTVGATVTCTRT